MSVKMMHLVFERFPLPGNDMVLALALADHAHDDGTNIFPGNERLADKTRMSKRTVIRLLQKFVEIGWLIKTRNADSRRGMASVYRISPDWIVGKDLTAAPSDKGVNLSSLSSDDEAVNVVIDGDYEAEKGDSLSPLIDQSLGDKLSPNNSDVIGDKSEHWVTNSPIVGDTAMSPQPSLTINTTIKSARESNPENKRPGLTPQGSLSIRLLNLKVKATSIHPTLLKWLDDQIPIEFIEQCVAIARMQKPLPEVISLGYLDAVIRSQLAEREKPKVDNSWKMTDAGWIAKGKELGVVAKIGESMDGFKSRVSDAVKRKGE